MVTDSHSVMSQQWAEFEREKVFWMNSSRIDATLLPFSPWLPQIKISCPMQIGSKVSIVAFDESIHKQVTFPFF